MLIGLAVLARQTGGVPLLRKSSGCNHGHSIMGQKSPRSRTGTEAHWGHTSDGLGHRWHPPAAPQRGDTSPGAPQPLRLAGNCNLESRSPVTLLHLRETAQFVEERDCPLDPHAQISYRRGLPRRQAVTSVAQHVSQGVCRQPLGEDIEQQVQERTIGLGEEPLGIGSQPIDVGGFPPRAEDRSGPRGRRAPEQRDGRGPRCRSGPVPAPTPQPWPRPGAAGPPPGLGCWRRSVDPSESTT